MILPSKRRKRKARRHDMHDGARGLPVGAGWLVVPCRHHRIWVKTPQLCSWDRNAKLKHSPSVNALPAVPFPGLPWLCFASAAACPGWAAGSVSRGLSSSCWCHVCFPTRRGDKRGRGGQGELWALAGPSGIVSFEFAQPWVEKSSPCGGSGAPLGLPGLAGCCSVFWRLSTKSRALSQPWWRGVHGRGEPILCPAQSCPLAFMWQAVLLLYFYF